MRSDKYGSDTLLVRGMCFFCQVVLTSEKIVRCDPNGYSNAHCGWCITVSLVTRCNTSCSNVLSNTVRLNYPVYFGTVGVLHSVMKASHVHLSASETVEDQC